MKPLRLELTNGTVLLLRENPATDAIAFRGSLAAGSAYAPPSVSEFVARLLLRGTRRRSAAKVADAIENVGAALSSESRHETISIGGRCTRETLRSTLAILTESLAEPAFAPAEVEKVRGEILGDIREERDDTRIAAMLRFFELVNAKGHPYRTDPKGDERTVARVRRRDLEDFHAARMGAASMIFGFSGNLDARMLRDTVAPAFERLEAGEPPKPLVVPRQPKPAHATVPMPHKSQADLVVGRAAIPRAHKDYYELHLANLLFGRIGLYGRLGDRVRDQLGLAYYSFSVLDARRAGGHWYVNAGVNPRNLGKAMEAVRAEIKRLEDEPFTDEEIRDGKNHLVGALQVNLERNTEYANALHDLEFYGLGMDFLGRFPRLVNALGREDIRKKARKFLDPDACSWVAAGPVRGLRLAF